MSSHGCACQRIDQIESELIRVRALILQRQQELARLKTELVPARIQAEGDATNYEDGIVPLDALEKKAILHAIERKGPLLAAKLLGIGKTTLYRKLHEYGFDIKQLRKEEAAA
jgi:two-component system response regulator HydG